MGQLMAWRIGGGIAAGGIIPIALALFGDLFPYEQRGRPLGWIFGAVAGGSAFGSTCGAVLYPFVGWRIVFLGVAFAGMGVVFIAHRHRALIDGHRQNHPLNLRQITKTYLSLLADRRGGRTYALLGYGIPGLLLGPAIGHLADRVGRRKIIPMGICLAALCAAALIPPAPIAVATIVVTLLSLGFDMSHPLLAGIITSLDPKRRGAAMGINAFVLFTGFGLGSLIFQALIRLSMNTALLTFAIVQLTIGLAAVKVFRDETAGRAATRH
jgi:predicted MFS family arabinose efflux permease